MRLKVGRHATSLLQLRPTSWPGSPGLYSQASTSTGRLQLLSRLDTRCINLRTDEGFEGNSSSPTKLRAGCLVESDRLRLTAEHRGQGLKILVTGDCIPGVLAEMIAFPQ